MRLIALPLLLAVAVHANRDGAGEAPVPQVVQFDTISEAEARALSGRWVTCKLTPYGPTIDFEGNQIFGVDDDDGDPITRTAWFAQGEPITEGKPMLSRGRLLCIRQGESVIRGRRFPAFTEVRLVDAAPQR